ncbi:GDSL-type esterase/lipase family protein [Nocardioides sp. TF02-7]|nr:GDSL-type esterase/lipase family protein [Nocardioides sp. TF02-7]UMG91750.1 GDSL-type esterase/lipase family protein [Nocardioides sp. TF02-7]
MSKAAAARKLAAAALYGGGGVSTLGAGLYGVMVAEAKIARRIIGPILEDPPPDATGWYGRGRPGPAIRIALLGDSSAAGYGVERVEETPGALLASGVSEHSQRRVYLRSFSVVGARSSDLAAQVDRALPIEPDVVVILIGGNDVTHTVLPVALGAPPLRGRTTTGRGRRQGRRRHVPRPRHRAADRSPAQAGGPRLVAPARRGPDDRDDRGGRPLGVAR